jgi:hypothetical protein
MALATKPLQLRSVCKVDTYSERDKAAATSAISACSSSGPDPTQLADVTMLMQTMNR